jgi:hypothetical protein
MDSELRTKILLSAQRALHGAVTRGLRGVTVHYDRQLITLRAYFGEDATEDDKEYINVALTEIMADMYNDIEKCRYEPVDLAFPKLMPGLHEWLYLRKNDTTNVL